MPLTPDDRILLQRLTNPADAPATGAQTPPLGDDETLLALVGAAQQGDHEAGERVLASMAFPLAAMARRSQQTTLAQFVSAAWLVVESYNLQRRHRVLTNLVLDALKQVTRDRVMRWDERLRPTPVGEEWPQPVDRPERGRAVAVIDSARELRLIDDPTHAVLGAVYVAGMSGREAAEATGTSHDMVRYRCSRALRLLRQHQRTLAAHSAG